MVCNCGHVHPNIHHHHHHHHHHHNKIIQKIHQH